MPSLKAFQGITGTGKFLRNIISPQNLILFCNKITPVSSMNALEEAGEELPPALEANDL
jgi:hypothetical protein